MKNSIVCPKCGRRTITQIGIKVKGQTIWHMSGYYNSKGSVRGKPNFIGCAWRYPTLNDLVKRKELLCFFCKFCGFDFPELETKEIIKYCNMKRIMQKLKS